MNFDSYIISDTKTAITVLPKCPPPPYSHKGFDKLSFKKKAFTLAEVLVTLTIIGVIAAMTIPTLMSKYQKHTYVVALKKAYSQLQNAVKMIPITEGCPAGDYSCAGMFDNTNASKKHIELLSKQFKTSKICLNTAKDCHPYIEKQHLVSGALPHEAAFITQDGTIYMSSIGAGFYVDINGIKEPNEFGIDIFAFWITTQHHKNIPQGTIIPWGDKRLTSLVEYSPSYFQYWKDANKCASSKLPKKSGLNALFCTGRILEEDKMNYDY